MRHISKAIVLFCVILLSCSREDTRPATSSAGNSNGHSQAISAYISPESPTANSELIALYKANNVEGDIRYSFRWYVDNELVQEGPLGTLEPGKFRKGSTVYAEIIPSDQASTGTPFKTSPVTIVNGAPVVTSVSLSPAEPAPGAIITATPVGSDPDNDEIVYSYEWNVNGVPVTQYQEANTFSAKDLHSKDQVFARVMANDRSLQVTPVYSNVVQISNAPPQITSSPPTQFQGGEYQYQVSATDPEGDKLTYALLKSPPNMTIDSSTGLIRWHPPAEVQGKTDVPVKISVIDNNRGEAYQEYSLTLEVNQ